LLFRRRSDTFRTLRRGLRGRRFAEALNEWCALAAGPPGSDTAEQQPRAGLPIEAVAGDRIRSVYRRIVRDGRRIDDDSPAEALHDLRKRGKELRYLLELFGSLFPGPVVKPMVSALKGLQDVLGRFQDRAVQAELLQGLADVLALQPGCLVDGGPAGELDARPRGDARGLHTGQRRRFVEKRQRAGGEPQLPGQLTPDALEGLVVTKHRAHPQAWRQRGPPGCVADDLGLLELEADHGLGVLVEHGQRSRPATHAHERQQRTYAEHGAEPVAQRAGRQLRSQEAWRRRDLRRPRRRSRLTQRERPRNGAPGGALSGETGRSQATVERVEQHTIEPPRPADRHLEPVGQQRNERGTVLRCR
jgi:hypothetical protein